MKTYKDYIKEDDSKVIEQLHKLSDQHYANLGKLLNKYKFKYDNTSDNGKGKWRYSVVYKNVDGIRIALISDVHPIYEKRKPFIVKYAEDLKSFPSKNIFNNDIELEKKVRRAPVEWEEAIHYVPDIYKKNLMDLEKYLKINYA